MAFRHLDVPYHSQFSAPAYARGIVEDGADSREDPRWAESGFDDLATTSTGSLLNAAWSFACHD